MSMDAKFFFHFFVSRKLGKKSDVEAMTLLVLTLYDRNEIEEHSFPHANIYMVIT